MKEGKRGKQSKLKLCEKIMKIDTEITKLIGKI